MNAVLVILTFASSLALADDEIYFCGSAVRESVIMGGPTEFVFLNYNWKPSDSSEYYMNDFYFLDYNFIIVDSVKYFPRDSIYYLSRSGTQFPPDFNGYALISYAVSKRKGIIELRAQSYDNDTVVVFKQY